MKSEDAKTKTEALAAREEETPLASAVAEADAATERAKRDSEHKLSRAEIEAIEEDALRRRFATPQKEATSRPPVSANEPPPPPFEDVMHDLKFPASKGDLVTRARNRGLLLELRYQLERIEDRLYVDMEQVKAAMRAAPN